MYKKSLIIFLLVILQSSFISYGQSEQAWMDQGNKAFKEGDLDMAIIYFEQVVGINPNNAVAYNNLGWTYFQKGDIKQANVFTAKAIAISPNNAVSYKNLSLYKVAENNLDEALSLINKSISLYDKDSYSYSLRGRIMMSKADNPKAMADFEKALSLDAKNKEALMNRGYLHLQARNFTNAIEDYDNYLSIDSKSYSAYASRGLALLELGQYQAAYEDFTRALDLSPDNTKLKAYQIYATYLKDRSIDACRMWKAEAEKGNQEANYFYYQYCTSSPNKAYELTLNGTTIQEGLLFVVKKEDAAPLLNIINLKPSSEVNFYMLADKNEKTIPIANLDNPKIFKKQLMLKENGMIEMVLTDLPKKPGNYQVCILFNNIVDEQKRVNFRIKISK